MPFEFERGASPVSGYRLVKCVGEGGAGQVWEAVTDEQEVVAMKFIRLFSKLANREWRAIKAMKSIRHEHILEIIEFIRLDEFLVIVTPLCESSLWDVFQQCTKEGRPGVPVIRLIRYVDECAAALDFLNERRHFDADRKLFGVQHRDVKPANILLKADIVKVADFGLAKPLEQSAVSHSGAKTAEYAPPEVYTERVVKTSDQYSLAVTYCQLRTGRLPFTGSTWSELMYAHIMSPPDLEPLMPCERTVVARALSKEPTERWPSCRAFVDALRQKLQHADVPETLSSFGRYNHCEEATGLESDVVPTHVDERIGCAAVLQKVEVAPFDADRARQLQRLWAERLKINLAVENSTGMKFVLVPPGEFMMGSAANEVDRRIDESLRRVRISKPYYVGVFPVTQGQWKSVMGVMGHEPWKHRVVENESMPATYISWFEAIEFCTRLSDRCGIEYRLLTEAEWEYAARAGSQARYSFGDSVAKLQDYAWYSRNAWDAGIKHACQTGRKLPNAFDLYDMHGNVWEWCADWYTDGTLEESVVDPHGPTLGCMRVYRGGSVHSSASECRCAVRGWHEPSYRTLDLGFRVCAPAK